MGVSFSTIFGARIGFEWVTEQIFSQWGDDDIKGALVIDLFAVRISFCFFKDEE